MIYKPTATQLELSTYTESDAFGDANLHPLIGDKPVTVTPPRHGDGHIVVTDDRGACHDFTGARWSQIKASMETYFGIVETGR